LGSTDFHFSLLCNEGLKNVWSRGLLLAVSCHVIFIQLSVLWRMTVVPTDHEFSLFC
jgi:hypothetical protein